jgi:hypothetical protein
LNVIFLIDNLFTPPVFGYARLKLNTFDILVYFIGYHSSKYILRLVLAELQLMHMKLQADALNLRVAEIEELIEGEME